MNKAIFFDRDGTINVDIGFLYEIDKLAWIDGAIDTIKYCNDNGYLVIIVTNQSGIARGLYTEAQVDELHRYMNEQLAKFGAHIDDFYYCPHHPEGTIDKYRVDCKCRKPKPQMVEDACKKYDIDKSKSLMIGDKVRDVECGENAGVRGVFFDGKNLFDTLKVALSI